MTNIRKNLSLIEELILKAEQLSFQDIALDSLIKEAKMITRNVFGTDSEHLSSISSNQFYSMVYPIDRSAEMRIWENGKGRLVNTFKAMKRELDLFGEDEIEEVGTSSSSIEKTLSNKIFIVHGHDREMKLDVKSTVGQLGLNPVILHEQNDDGKTVIEKLEDHSEDCDFAIVLLSPDDIGYSEKAGEGSKKYRARQNVILELGLFIGLVKRKNVFVLVRHPKEGEIELPNDYSGVIFTPYVEDDDTWKFKLVQRLRGCGYKVSLDDII